MVPDYTKYVLANLLLIKNTVRANEVAINKPLFGRKAKHYGVDD